MIGTTHLRSPGAKAWAVAQKKGPAGDSGPLLNEAQEAQGQLPAGYASLSANDDRQLL